MPAQENGISAANCSIIVFIRSVSLGVSAFKALFGRETNILEKNYSSFPIVLIIKKKKKPKESFLVTLYISLYTFCFTQINSVTFKF